MATVVVLLDGGDPDVVLGPSSAPELVRLGVGSVSVLRDGEVVGLIFEGWMFDPASATEAIAAIAPGRRAARISGRSSMSRSMLPAGTGRLDPNQRPRTRDGGTRCTP